MVLAVSAFALASCVQVELETEEAVGYLCAPALEVDMTVDDLMDTKALDFELTAPEVADFHYLVKDKDGAVKHDEVGLWEAMAMPVGPYSVEAWHGTDGFGSPYFYGKTGTDAVIDPLEREVPALTIQLANALVKVGIKEDFAQHFTLETVTLSSGSLSPITLSASEIADWYFVPAGRELSVKLTGKSSAGTPVEYAHKVTPAAKSATSILCGASTTNVPVINLPDQSAGAWATRLYITPATFENISADNQAAVAYELIQEGGDWANAVVAERIEGQYFVVKGLANSSRYTVRARIGNLLSGEQTVEVMDNLPGTTVALVHDNNDDPNVMLSGTDATLDLKLSGVLKSLNEAGLLQFNTSLNKSGALVRTSTSPAGLMTGETSAWPYLPQGNDYALTVTHKLSTETEYISSSAIGGFVSNPPVFGITLSKSYTSYDYGVGNADNGFSKNIDIANNNCKPESLYGAGVSWNIAGDLMTGDKYQTGRSVNVFLTQGGSPKATYTPTSLASAYSVGEITDLEWKQYEVSAEVSFDNVKKTTETRIHHITGLPYKMTHKANEGVHPWNKEKGNITWEDNRVNMSYASGTGPRISSPSFYMPVQVNVTIKPNISRNNFGTNGNLQIFTDENNKLYDKSLKSQDTYSTPIEASMSPSLNKWYIHYTYMAIGPRTYVYAFDIDYR